MWERNGSGDWNLQGQMQPCSKYDL